MRDLKQYLKMQWHFNQKLSKKKNIYKSVYVLKISVIVNFLLSAFTKGAQNSKESNTYSNVIFNSSMSVLI